MIEAYSLIPGVLSELANAQLYRSPSFSSICPPSSTNFVSLCTPLFPYTLSCSKARLMIQKMCNNTYNNWQYSYLETVIRTSAIRVSRASSEASCWYKGMPLPATVRSETISYASRGWASRASILSLSQASRTIGIPLSLNQAPR